MIAIIKQCGPGGQTSVSNPRRTGWYSCHCPFSQTEFPKPLLFECPRLFTSPPTLLWVNRVFDKPPPFSRWRLSARAEPAPPYFSIFANIYWPWKRLSSCPFLKNFRDFLTKCFFFEIDSLSLVIISRPICKCVYSQNVVVLY